VRVASIEACARPASIRNTEVPVPVSEAGLHGGKKKMRGLVLPGSCQRQGVLLRPVVDQFHPTDSVSGPILGVLDRWPRFLGQGRIGISHRVISRRWSDYSFPTPSGK